MGTAATLSTAITGETLRLCLTLLLGALAITAVARLRTVTPGTTLVAPWRWAMLGVLATTCAALLNARDPASAAAPWLRYLAGATLLAAPMAVLGAKRPQDRAWQWVVLSLVVFVMLPAGHQWLYRPASDLHIEIAWQWFVLAIAAIGVGNYLTTAHALAATFAGFALYCYLGDQFPAWLRAELPERDLMGLAALAVAAAVAKRTRRRKLGARHDRLWREFRDLFGAAWGLRCAERFNAAAAQSGWQATLSWQGFVLPDGQTELAPAEFQCLENLLRRFVSPAWIAERIDGSRSESPHESTVPITARHESR